MTRVFLGCAAYDRIEPRTATAREALMAAAGRAGRDALVGQFELVGSGIGRGYGTVGNLELLAKAALDAGADLLLYHDADIAFTVDDVNALMLARAAWGPRCVIGSVCKSSSYPGFVIGRKSGQFPRSDGMSLTPETEVGGAAGVIRFDEIGFGLVLIPTALLQEMIALRGYAFREEWRGNTRTTIDVAFSQDATDRGYDVLVATDARPEHKSKAWDKVG